MTTIMTRAVAVAVVTITMITMTTIMTRAVAVAVVTITMITMTTIMTRAVAAVAVVPPTARAMCLWLYRLIQIWLMNPMMRRTTPV
jgi:hypothetical protein